MNINRVENAWSVEEENSKRKQVLIVIQCCKTKENGDYPK